MAVCRGCGLLTAPTGGLEVRRERELGEIFLLVVPHIVRFLLILFEGLAPTSGRSPRVMGAGEEGGRQDR